MSPQEFFKKNRMISYEFSKYILEHPEIEEKIPFDAQVVFLLENDPEFNEMSYRFSEKQKEKDQPIVFVRIKDIAPIKTSRLIEPQLELVK